MEIKYTLLSGLSIASFAFLSSCASKPNHGVEVTPLPGTSGCLIKVPDRVVKGGAGVGATGPVLTGDAKIEATWGYRYFVGCGGTIKSLDSAAPASAEKKDAAAPKSAVTDKVNSVAKAVVDAGNAAEKNPALKAEVSSLLTHTIAFYKAVDKSDDLKPQKGSKTTMSAAIANLEKASQEYTPSPQATTTTNWSMFRSKRHLATADLGVVNAVKPTKQDLLKKGTEIEAMAKAIQK